MLPVCTFPSCITDTYLSYLYIHVTCTYLSYLYYMLPVRTFPTMEASPDLRNKQCIQSQELEASHLQGLKHRIPHEHLKQVTLY